MLGEIPEAMQDVTEANPVSRTPVWLAEGNPLANHPWRDDPDARLPEQVDTLVIGAGFTGASLAYHWAKKAPPERSMAVLEMDDPACGASGRNEGLVVMGRYFAMVHRTVLKHLDRVRADLDRTQRDRLAGQFAGAYCRAAYRNGDMIEQTVNDEGFDCDYARSGWVQATEAENQEALEASVAAAGASGCTDWTKIGPREVLEKTGMRVEHDAGFSIAAASFHPAKWVWCLLEAALSRPHVKLFTRTKVQRTEDAGSHYVVHTTRGVIRTKHVVSALESYMPLLYKQFHGVILPVQTQAAYGRPGPEAMKPHVGISSALFFCGKHAGGVMVGSDATRVADHEAGGTRPSRFLTRFILGQLRLAYGPYRWHLSNEWSGTASFTPDEFPIVGCFDGRHQYVIGGMAGSGTAVSFNAARCISNRILGNHDEADDYPAEYFSPTRLLDPANHRWPEIFSGELQ